MRGSFIIVAVAVGAVALAGCETRCKDGTVLVDLSLVGAARAADRFAVSVADGDGSVTRSATVGRAAVASTGTLEIDFGAGYPRGHEVMVRVDALAADVTLASASQAITLSDACERLALTLDGGAAPDLGNPVCTAPLAGGDVWVDVARGSDDGAHGGGAGACAFKSITAALKVARGKIRVAAGLYQAPAESYPLTLTGTQALECQVPATADGPRARLVGAGTSQGAYAGVVLMGDGDRLAGCELTAPAGQNDIDNCVLVLSAGTHAVADALLHDCAGAGKGKGILALSGKLTTITGTSFRGLDTAVLADGNVDVSTSSFSSVGVCIGCQSGMPITRACMNTADASSMICSTACTQSCAGFKAACP